MKILFLGDIVGAAGCKAAINTAKFYLNEKCVDLVIANGENASDGFGITPSIASNLFKNGISVITTGNHAWAKKEIIPYFLKEPRLLRPINYPPEFSGNGSIVINTLKGPVGVINLQGRFLMKNELANPFLSVVEDINKIKKIAHIIIIDFHAEATSEKLAMGYYLDGIVSLVIGTHTHVATADEQILPKGTGFITDVGMCGPRKSVLGFSQESSIEAFLLEKAPNLSVATGANIASGLLVDINNVTGVTRNIKRIIRQYY